MFAHLTLYLVRLLKFKRPASVAQLDARPTEDQEVAVAQLDARLTGDQEVAGSNPAEVGNILSWRLIMKYFLRPFSPFH